LAALRNTYVNCQTDDGRPLPWQPPDLPDGARPDSIFFGAALAEMDGRLDEGGLTVYCTQDLDELPSYGRDVVVLLIGDEFTRVPSYFGRVRAIFRTLAPRPALASSLLREPSWVNFWSFAWYLRTWGNHAPGMARYRAARRRGSWTAPIWQLPVGTADQLELPVTPMAERAHDVFFGGSVGHHAGAGAKEAINPKVMSRSSMVAHARALAERRPELSIDLVTTGGFLESVAADAESYSRSLMDARISLVPRGTAIDTFRLSQSFRYGCVAVADAVPSHPSFYDGAPVVRLRGWDRLEEVVVPLLADAGRLEDLHRRSLEWWRTRVSDEAVGAFMAGRLNELAA
jgi:hypothetical protein